jgi:pilus assembly protein Flp/PilA
MKDKIMLKIITTVMTRLGREEKGASAVEYAILVGAVGAAVVLAVANYKTALGTLFTNIIKSTW